MSRSELEHFVAIMDSGCDEVNDLDDLINLTYNLDNYDFIPDIKDYDDLGRNYFFEGGYGMIDGIINNGPKEDKASEKGGKTSIMDRLKSAKTAQQTDKPSPHKEMKSEREL